METNGVTLSCRFITNFEHESDLICSDFTANLLHFTVIIQRAPDYIINLKDESAD